MLKNEVHDLNGLIQSNYFKADDFNEDGTIKTDVIMKYVIEPTIGEILCFQMEALDLGINVIERKKHVEFAGEECSNNWFNW